MRIVDFNLPHDKGDHGYFTMSTYEGRHHQTGHGRSCPRTPYTRHPGFHSSDSSGYLLPPGILEI